MKYESITPTDTMTHDTFEELMEWLEEGQDDYETTSITMHGRDITPEIAVYLHDFWTSTMSLCTPKHNRHPLVDKYFDPAIAIEEMEEAVKEGREHIEFESMIIL